MSTEKTYPDVIIDSLTAALCSEYRLVIEGGKIEINLDKIKNNLLKETIKDWNDQKYDAELRLHKNINSSGYFLSMYYGRSSPKNVSFSLGSMSLDEKKIFFEAMLKTEGAYIE
jgi:hypothetical protein